MFPLFRGWPNEDHEELTTRLNDLISPVFDRVYDGRIGKRRPTEWVPHPLPSQEFLLDLFEEREPGILYYRRNVFCEYGTLVAKAGALAGYLDNTGYWVVSINKRKHPRSRIIWKMIHGEDPLNELDHLNRDRSDDRIENLKNKPRGQNLRNARARDGSTYVIYYQNRDNYCVFFGLTFWPDEPAEEIVSRLNELITPEIDAVYAARVGRRRPWRRPSWLPPELSAPLLRGRAL
jgi:HNH endonuclease